MPELSVEQVKHIQKLKGQVNTTNECYEVPGNVGEYEVLSAGGRLWLHDFKQRCIAPLEAVCHRHTYKTHFPHVYQPESEVQG